MMLCPILHSKLPNDIIHHISLYTGKIKLRNGKYMFQIPNTDKRYALLEKTLPRLWRYKDRHSHHYGLRVTFHSNTIHVKMINIEFDFESGIIKYCYRNLLHKETKLHPHDSNVKFICPLYNL